MHSALRFGFAITVLCSGIAHADFFSDLNNAIDTVKKVANSIPKSPGTAESNASTSTSGNAAAALSMPFDFSPYPSSRLYMRIDNPFDRVQMPISTPVSTPDGYLSRYNVPIDGKVTMFEFVHRTDDSPILIRQHYENWMAQAGFERLLICDSPCADAQWRKAIDPTSRLDVNYFPSKPTYIAGYKNNAMLVVGIGSMNWEHTSVLKVVEGKVLDPSVWEAVTKPKTVAPSVPLSRPAAQVQTPFIEDIAAGDINKTIASTKGILLLHLTSNDKGCGHCIQSNARFESLAAKSPASAKFARVAWRPWKSAFEDTFIKNHGINGVPTYLAYKDGILVKRINGNVSQTEVDGLLSAE